MAIAPADARATTILPNCGTCGSHNTAWDLTLALVNDAQNIYSLTVTATYGSPRDFFWINDISFKIDAFTNNYDANPTVTGPVEALGWTVVAGGINSGGCHANTNNGFFCAQSNLFGATWLGNSTDTWVFLMNINNTLPNFASGPGTFKAQFTDLLGNKVGSLLSEEITFGTPNNQTPPTVPEPATLALFGAGLAAAATAIRRRRKA